MPKRKMQTSEHAHVFEIRERFLAIYPSDPLRPYPCDGSLLRITLMLLRLARPTVWWLC